MTKRYSTQFKQEALRQFLWFQAVSVLGFGRNPDHISTIFA